MYKNIEQRMHPKKSALIIEEFIARIHCILRYGVTLTIYYLLTGLTILIVDILLRLHDCSKYVKQCEVSSHIY